MNIVIYDSLLPHIISIQPHIAWLLNTVPAMITDQVDRMEVEDVITELVLKQAKLQGAILNLEANLIPISEEGSVTVISPDTIDGLNIIEQLVREALAEVIVTRGEMELAAESVAICEDGLDEDAALDTAKAAVAALGGNDRRSPLYTLQETPEESVTTSIIATLKNEYDGVANITMDDGCYVLKLKDKSTSYWFPEAVDILKHLPVPGKRHGVTKEARAAAKAYWAILHQDDTPEIDADGFPIDFPVT